MCVSVGVCVWEGVRGGGRDGFAPLPTGHWRYCNPALIVTEGASYQRATENESNGWTMHALFLKCAFSDKWIWNSLAFYFFSLFKEVLINSQTFWWIRDHQLLVCDIKWPPWRPFLCAAACLWPGKLSFKSTVLVAVHIRPRPWPWSKFIHYSDSKHILGWTWSNFIWLEGNAKRNSDWKASARNGE